LNQVRLESSETVLKGCPVAEFVKRALAQNPNLLRTLIGLLLVLILVLGYAVHAATVKTEYFVIETTNSPKSPEIINLSTLDDGDQAIRGWAFSTTNATSWINVSLQNAPPNSTFEVSSDSEEWWSDGRLGEDDAVAFNCREPSDTFVLVSRCEAAMTHSKAISDSGTVTLRGLASLELPLTGIATTRSDSLADAEQYAQSLIEVANTTREWTITLTSETNTSFDGMIITVEIATHQVKSVEEFSVDPIRELVWGVAAVIGCFAVALTPAFGMYFASQARMRMEKSRLVLQESE